MKTPDAILDSLVSQWLYLKDEETAALEARRDIEQKLFAYVPADKLGTFHAKTKLYDVSVRFDSETIAKGGLYEQLPEAIRDFVLVPKREFSKSGYEQAVRVLTALALTPAAREQLAHVKRAVEEGTETKAERPYVHVTKR